ncbi:hypothetical protein WJX73_003664 [Symbiochloris irregularis]|uniref:Uncharacterized protein n=1 Tax=Symbiochloris irregularis TaxID=706552 RepID=A0AAW1NN02_9CHLO
MNLLAPGRALAVLLLPILIYASVAVAQRSGCATYTIKPGDGFDALASRFNVTSDDLSALNPQITDRGNITAGNILSVPPCSSASSPAGAPAPAPTGSAGGTCGNYTVEGGDTFDNIASKFNTSSSILASLNPQLQNTSSIIPDQILQVPPCNGTSGGPAAAVEPQSTTATPQAAPAPSGSQTTPSGQTCATYTIQPGDTFDDIASKLKVPSATLQALNPQQNTSVVVTNNTLYVPPCTSATQGSSISAGAIAGIVVGAVAAVAIAAVAVFFVLRRRRSRLSKHRDASLLGNRAHDHSSDPLQIFLRQADWQSLSSNSQGSSSSTELSKSAKLDNEEAPSGIHSTSSRLAARMLHLEWRVEPRRIDIAQDAEGRYVMLGSGGYGTVYKGIMDGVNEVAIKLLKPETQNSASSIDKFIAEIDVLRACRDQHIVTFNGAWANKEIMYYVCEFCNNGDLDTALADDSLCESLSWYQKGRTIALQIARGLFYLHSNGIVHLDIKSPNILLTETWQAKIADVGLARLLVTKTHLSQTLPGGTYNWQAPETLLGLPSSYPADIFSYGVVLLEIITGHRPVRGQYPVPEVPEQCPEAIKELALRCMESEPDKRPTAKEIITIIQQNGSTSASNTAALPSMLML